MDLCGRWMNGMEHGNGKTIAAVINTAIQSVNVSQEMGH
jgi:hypothetical protein